MGFYFFDRMYYHQDKKIAEFLFAKLSRQKRLFISILIFLREYLLRGYFEGVQVHSTAWAMVGTQYIHEKRKERV